MIRGVIKRSILYRPPKVRPKNLTIGRSVFSWQNIHLNLRKKIYRAIPPFYKSTSPFKNCSALTFLIPDFEKSRLSRLSIILG